MKKARFDIGVIIPLEQELQSFFEVFSSSKNMSDEDRFLHEVDSGEPDISMVVIHLNGMGNAEAGRATVELLDRFDIGLIVCLGIAGGLSNDLFLGDVCYTGRVLDVLENSKTIDIENSATGIGIEFSSQPFETPDRITRSINYSRTQPDGQRAYLEWRDARCAAAQALYPDEIVGRKGIKEKVGTPQSMNGTIVCGMVSKSEAYNQKLKDADRKVLAIETESAAVFREAKRRSVDAITIRGISDYADKLKGTLEGSTKGAVRTIASGNAVTFLRSQFGNPYFVHQLTKLRPGAQQSLALTNHLSEPNQTIEIVELLSASIEDRLREFSPEYRLHPKGYKIPAPRVRKQHIYNTGFSDNYQPPLEIREAIRFDKLLILSIPRSYPDQSLPWIIAHELLDAEVDQKQVVPIVVDGSRVTATRGLKKLADVSLPEFDDTPGKQIVFIVENLPLGSTTRLKLLTEEVKKFPDAQFIFLSDSKAHPLAESDFRIELSVSAYDVCAVSFTEISNFIQRSFDMNGSQAEVVAKRLWDTFNEFDLSAHPTYFAGIPRETLMALLHANRRVELLQLAVDGFLTIVVADDPSDVSLSRTTRSRFLSDLVVELKLEKRQYDQSGLVARVRTFAEQQDFDIDPLAFIKGFEDKGIIHFENNRVEFSLPFIEHYLFAKKLAENEHLAAKYFDFTGDAFDPQIFDMYAELGPSEEIKVRVSELLDASIISLKSLASDEHILLTNEINPAINRSLKTADTLQKNLKRAIDDVQTGRSGADKKQKILDLAERIQESTSRHAKADGSPNNDEASKELDQASKAFLLGTLLLGSGSEHLLADEKRSISSKLLDSGADIVDIWTRRRTVIDFSAFKDELMSDEFIEEFQNSNGNSLGADEIKTMISTLVDLIEGAILSEPLRNVLGLLCEQARSKVLSKSLQNTSANSEFGKLLHAAWLTDIDPQQGKSLLKTVSKDLPPVVFLRSAMALHCMSRTIWSHWKQPDRLALLDAASDFLKPISMKIDKAARMRQIKKN